MPANDRQPHADPQARRLARFEQLHELGVALAAAATREDVAAIVLQRALALVGARAVSLFLESGPGELELVRAVGLSERFQQRYRRIGPGSAVPQVDAFRTGEPVWLRDPQEIAARYPGAAPLAAAEGDQAWAAVPLVLDRRRGAIGIRFPEPRAFDEEERSLIEAVTLECALALDRSRLHDAQRRLAERIARLQRVTSELSAAVTPEEVGAIGLRELLASGARAGAVLQRGAAGDLALVVAQGLTPPGRDALARVAAEPAARDPGWLAGRAAIAASAPALAAALAGGEEWAAIPLRVEGRDVGVIVVALDPEHPPDEDVRGDAVALAQQCAQALERARLFDAQRRLAERLARVQSTSSSLSGAATPPDVAAVAAAAFAILGASGAELHALDRADRVTRVPRAGEPSPPARSIDAPTLAGEVVRTGRAVWISSRAELAERFPREAADPARGGEGAWAAVPLLASGETLGALTVAFPDERTLDEDDRAFVRLVAGPCAEALARARLYEAMAKNRLDSEWSAGVLDALFTAAPVALALFDREMRFTRVNAPLATMNGLPAAAHAGRTPLELLPGLPGEQIAAAFRTVLEEGRGIEVAMSGETPAAPGVTRRWRATWFPVRVGGAIVGVGVLVVEEPPGRG